MKQQCPMAFIYLSWTLYIGGLVFFTLKGQYLFAIIWLVGTPLIQLAYVRAFPSISRYIGYGSVKDQQATKTVMKMLTKVTIYSALGCPFCPVVKQRLIALQAEMEFDLTEVDVKLKPDLLISKGIRSVPVVEVGEERIVGHATSEQLANLIQGSAAWT